MDTNTDFILSSQEVLAAENTLRDAAQSGNWRGAAMALHAHNEAKRIVTPGDDWRVTVLQSVKPVTTYTLAVVGFNSLGPVVLDCDGYLTDLGMFTYTLPQAAYCPGERQFYEFWNVNVTDEDAIIAQLIERSQDGAV